MKIIFSLLMLPVILAGCVSAPKSREPSAISNTVSCTPRMTDVKASLETWRDGWKVAPGGWQISLDKYSTRSSYELYSRYFGLAFVMGVPPGDMMKLLKRAGKEGPDVQEGWNWEDYSRMGEAAAITGRTIQEAMEFLKEVYKQGNESWNYLDYSRSAAAGFIGGATAQQTYQTLKDTYRMSRHWWTDGSFSRIAEAALIAGKTADESVKMLDSVYEIANKVTPGWDDDDYARVTRAALLMDITAEQAVQTLADVYRETTAVSNGWNYRDYSRMAAAAIITGKSAKEAAMTLKSTWDQREISPDWNYADYSMMAAAALIGKGNGTDTKCPAFFKAW